MPWVLSPHLDTPSPCERACERSAFSFYRAVRERLPAWLLEDMRTMEVFCWEDGGARAFPPSEALLYAVVHDHQAYARHLLDRFDVAALRPPRCGFCRCRGGGCAHAGKSAVRVAVDLSRAGCLLLLLARGARAEALDAALQKLASCAEAERRAARRCVDLLLLYGKPLVPPPRCLREEPQRWQSVLGKQVYSWLIGLAPPPLLLLALRGLARSDRIGALPDFLQTPSWG